MEIRKTDLNEIDEIQRIYDSARLYMQQSGNPNQWLDGYPQEELILLDIRNKQHFVCIESEKILGCFALIEGDDPTYRKIEKGKWLNSFPYATIHRLATLEHGKGIGTFCLNWCSKQHPNIKVDTHEDNISMQRLLIKNGFQRCGIILNRWGDERIAFQKAQTMKISYSEISKTYDNHRSYSELHMEPLIRFAHLKGGMKILDVGCGTGNLSLELREHIQVEIVGIDVSFNMLQKARTKTLDVLCADVDFGLPFGDRAFDAVIGSYFLHYVKNPGALMKECFRVLKDDSRLLFLTSSHDQIEQLHPVIKEFFPSLTKQDKERFPDIPELDHFLKAAGFTKIRHEELTIDKIPIDNFYLEKVKNRFVSTFFLIPEKEFNEGVKKLETFILGSQEPVYREWRGTMICGDKV